jgi:hypothetical protein
MIPDRVRSLVPQSEIEAFCRRWKVKELALFGSALREDFDPESDIDLLVTFDEDAAWGLFDLVAMERELAERLGRRVDLLTRRAVEQSRNWMRRRAILDSAETIYAA